MTEVLSFAKTGTWCLAHSNWKEEKKNIFQVLFLCISLFPGHSLSLINIY